jgi:hypothetical protein
MTIFGRNQKFFAFLTFSGFELKAEIYGLYRALFFALGEALLDYLLLLFQIRSSQRESLKFGTFFDNQHGIRQNYETDKAASRLTKESRRQLMLRG